MRAIRWMTRWPNLLLPCLCFVLILGPAATTGADSTPTADEQSATTWQEEASRLVAAVLGSTPMVDDLRQLTDEIGGFACWDVDFW